MVALFKPGDWLVLALSVAVVAMTVDRFWLQGTAARSAVIRSGGNAMEIPLSKDSRYHVRGPLGISEIEVRGQRVRVARDPSPKQYCVKQGWLSRAGETALCLPNQVSVQINGARPLYDSLNF